MGQTLAIGVDLGGTKIATALVDGSGAVLAAPGPDRTVARAPAFVLARIADEVNALAGQAPGEVAGVGIGSPGIVDPVAGTVTGAVNLAWDHVDLAAGVRRALAVDLPVYIAKDTNASALGERQFGAGRSPAGGVCDDLVYLSIGTGFGAGVISAGRLVIGGHCAAADLGHLSLDPQGRPCPCGGRGCVEGVLSGRGLRACVGELIESGFGPTELSPESDPAAILAAGRSGDALAREAFAMQGRWLGQVFALCMMYTDPEVIILGGGLGVASADLVLPTAIETVSRYASPAQPRPRFETSRLADPSVGAASLVFEKGRHEGT